MNPYNLCKSSRKTASCAFALVVMSLLAYPVWRTFAAGGNLDTSFSSNGKYELSQNDGYGRSFSEVRIQVDPNNIQNEKVIAIFAKNYGWGCETWFDDYDFYVTRLTTSGVKDSTFGDNGVRKINFNGSGTASELALQPDGKILVAGMVDSCNQAKLAIARLTFDGALDTSFGTNGTVIASDNGVVEDMVLQADGKIILVGKIYLYSIATATYNWYSSIWRYNANGTPDMTFSGNGRLIMEVWPGGADGFRSVFVESNGSLVVMNASNSPNGYRLRRVSATGSPQGTLNVNAPSGSIGYAVRGVGGKIWVVGSYSDHGAIFSHNADGSIDTTFGGGTGLVTSSQIPWSVGWFDVASVPFTKKYVVVGYAYRDSSSGANALVSRYYANGALDTSFGTNGSTETDGFVAGFSQISHDEFYQSVAVGLSGKIVASGFADVISGAPNLEFGIMARYWGN